jgi:hypothetical protein
MEGLVAVILRRSSQEHRFLWKMTMKVCTNIDHAYSRATEKRFNQCGCLKQRQVIPRQACSLLLPVVVRLAPAHPWCRATPCRFASFPALLSKLRRLEPKSFQ